MQIDADAWRQAREAEKEAREAKETRCVEERKEPRQLET